MHNGLPTKLMQSKYVYRKLQHSEHSRLYDASQEPREIFVDDSASACFITRPTVLSSRLI